MYIEASPLLIALFFLGRAAVRAAIRRRAERRRVVRPYLGETIPGRPDS